ncbi:ORF2 [Feline anellovirus]|uniref:ORF2 n=1 Tax=Feline anellovirus TaxID=1861840 RepID=A0A1S5RAP5_9VIRU|nr:ORF2 [Feline anellovirus]ANK58166.1 ORF2 [Feline anellovirus]
MTGWAGAGGLAERSRSQGAYRAARVSRMGPLEQEQLWLQSCKVSHDIWCACPDWRQHIFPTFAAEGAAWAGTTGTDTGEIEDKDLADVVVSFDLGEPTDDGDPGEGGSG